MDAAAECARHLERRAHGTTRSRIAQQSVTVAPVEDEFQAHVDGMLDDGDVDAALQLLDHFVSPMVAPEPDAVARLLDVVFEKGSGRDASARLEQAAFEYLQRLRNVTVANYEPLGDRAGVQAHNYADWQKLCALMALCSGDGGSSVQQQRRARLLLRYCVGVLEDNLVRRRGSVRQSIAASMLKDAPSLALQLGACLDAFYAAHTLGDVELVETVLRLLHIVFCVHTITELHKLSDFALELAILTQQWEQAKVLALCQALPSSVLRAALCDRLVSDLMDPSTLPDDGMPLSLSKIVAVYMRALPRAHGGSGRRRPTTRPIDYYVTLAGVLAQSYLRASRLSFADEALLASWDATIEAVRRRMSSHAHENEPAPGGAGVPRWATTLNLLAAAYAPTNVNDLTLDET